MLCYYCVALVQVLHFAPGMRMIIYLAPHGGCSSLCSRQLRRLVLRGMRAMRNTRAVAESQKMLYLWPVAQNGSWLKSKRPDMVENQTQFRSPWISDLEAYLLQHFIFLVKSMWVVLKYLDEFHFCSENWSLLVWLITIMSHHLLTFLLLTFFLLTACQFIMALYQRENSFTEKKLDRKKCVCGISCCVEHRTIWCGTLMKISAG